MRKVTTPAKVCKECGHTLIAEKYDRFCDQCKEKIDPDYHLNTTIFWQKDSDTTRQEFCNWHCFMDWIKNFPLNKKTVNFVTMPFLGGSSKDFESELEEFIQSSEKTAEAEG